MIAMSARSMSAAMWMNGWMVTRIRAADLEEWLHAAIVTPPPRRLAAPLDLKPPVAPRHVAGRPRVPADAGHRDASPGARSAEPYKGLVS